MHNEADYIPVEQVAVMLAVSTRQATRYKDRVRTIKAGNRILYHRGDIEEQARLKGREAEAKRAAEEYKEQKPRKTELMPMGDVLEYLREKDAQMREKDAHNERLQQQLLQAVHRIGE